MGLGGGKRWGWRCTKIIISGSKLQRRGSIYGWREEVV